MDKIAPKQDYQEDGGYSFPNTIWLKQQKSAAGMRFIGAYCAGVECITSWFIKKSGTQ